MGIKYFEAPDVKEIAEEIVDILELQHIEFKHVYFYRSVGSKSKWTIARIYGLGKIWQKTLKISPSYIIEVISERYDKLDNELQLKTVIHELLHIPKGFSGGFRSHKGYVTKKTIERLYLEMKEKKLKKRFLNVPSLLT
ncbi:MAG: putative metallopeptidase [Candidatus Bathyarchaeota archaeon]